MPVSECARDTDGTPLCSRCRKRAPNKNVRVEWKCADCIQVIEREREICYQFFTLNEKTTYHELQHCNGGYYNYHCRTHKNENNKPEKDARGRLELLYKNQMNVIVHEICNQYCLKYNDMYDINLIKPLWYMIFDFASEEHGDMLSFIDCSNYLTNDQKIQNALLTLIDVSYQLSDCEKIPNPSTNETNQNQNQSENENHNQPIGLMFDEDYDIYLHAYYYEDWEISVNAIKIDLKTIENMLNVIKMQDKRWIGAWNNGPYMCIQDIKLDSERVIKMVKTCEFFKEYQSKQNKYYKTFINLIINFFGRNDLNRDKCIFQFEEKYRMYHYFVVPLPYTDIAYGIYVLKQQICFPE